MLFLSPLLLLTTAAFAASISDRSTATVPPDLVTINNDVVSLTNAINSWNGQASGVIPIQNIEQKLEKDLNTTITHANNNPVLSCPDSSDIVNYTKGALEPNIQKLVRALINRKPQFQAVGIYLAVRQDIANLRKLFAQLFSALLPKMCNAATQSALAAVAKAVDNDWVTAQNTYS